MKLIRIAISLHFILFFIPHLFAQGNNAGNTEPVQICPSTTFLCTNQMTPSPILSVNSDLPDLEYVIINQSVAATNGSGPAIVGIDSDGVFLPTAFGVMPGSSIDIIPIAYNLADIQSTIDDVLKGLVFGFIPCCNFVGTACTDLNNSGILCGSDVTSLQDIFPLFNATGDLLSITDFVTAVMGANTQLQDPATPETCGGGDLIAYAYGNSCTYSVLEDIALLNLPDHIMNEVILRSDYIESAAVVSNTLDVEYFAGNHVELISPFEVELGGEFLADILICP